MRKKPPLFLMELTILPVLLLTSIYCNAQGKVSGMVVDINGLPLSNANVLLLKYKDSSLVKGSVTSKNGIYNFDNLASENYLIACSYTGFKAAYSPVIYIVSNEQLEVNALRLAEKEEMLSAVAVRAKKPLFEQKIDRMVIKRCK